MAVLRTTRLHHHHVSIEANNGRGRYGRDKSSILGWPY